MAESAWAHLPNAEHIDAVLVHLAKHPERWSTAWNTTRDAIGNIDLDATGSADRETARNAAWNAAWNAVWNTVWDESQGIAWNKKLADVLGRRKNGSAVRNAARNAAWDAVQTLISDDDCAYILSLPPGSLRLLISNGHPAAILLNPAVLAMGKPAKT